MLNYNEVLENLKNNPKSWLITGVAGFIGSHLLEALLKLDQKVIGLDNFSTGYQSNLDDVKDNISASRWKNFSFIRGDITRTEDCMTVSGFVNMLFAAKEQNVKSFTYASSSSVYGDHPTLPKLEENIGSTLSPYAVSKYTNEIYASVFAKCYSFQSIGLRYFNVFGTRQDPNGAYAAVIPRWIDLFSHNNDIVIYGDGETSRDFCHIDNVVQANILSSVASSDAKDSVYNIAVGDRTSLNELYVLLSEIIGQKKIDCVSSPIYKDFRDGDIRHSIADIEKARKALNYFPEVRIRQGLERLIEQHF